MADRLDDISQRVQEVVKCMRRLWPKYDQDLDQQINEKQLIIKFLEHSFSEAKLHDDFQQLLWQQRDSLTIDDLIYQEAQINLQKIANQMQLDQELYLNQAQIINVIKRFYGDHTAHDPRARYNNQLQSNRKTQNNMMRSSMMQSRQTDRNLGEGQSDGGDYVAYYQRVQDFAKQKNWDAKKTNSMLSNRDAFEKVYKLSQRKNVTHNVDQNVKRMHDLHVITKAKHQRAKEIKDEEEIQQAYQMSQMPLQRKFESNNGDIQIRTMEQFMEDQIKHEQRRYENLKSAIMREEMQEENLYQPKINQKSIQILEQSGKDPIQESKIKKIQKEQQYIKDRKAKEEVFKPKINQISQRLHKGVDLMQDAQRRQTTKKQISEMLRMKQNMDKSTAQISSKSDKVMYDRFDQDFVLVCQECELIPENDEEINTNDLDIMISCAQMSQLFLNLGFVRPDGRENEQIQLANIWKTLGGDSHGKELLPLQRSKVFMCAIQNFHIDWIIDPYRDEFTKVDPSNIGRIEENNFYLKSEEISYITKKYVDLYKNRMEKLAKDKKSTHLVKAIKKQKYGNVYDFKPKISQKNKQLAEQKLLKEPNSAYLAIEDRLMKKGIDVKIERELQKASKDKQELNENPYRPFIRESSKRIAVAKSITLIPRMNDGQQLSKWDLLHMESRKNLQKRDKNDDEIKFMRAKEEYTFQPNQSNGRNASPGLFNRSQSSAMSTSFQKNSIRSKGNMFTKPTLDQGRKRLSSASPSKMKSNNSRYSQYTEDKDQTFQISVNIGGSKKQTQAHIDADPSSIASRFINEHGVDPKYHYTLTQLIDDQISKIKENALNQQSTMNVSQSQQNSVQKFSAR